MGNWQTSVDDASVTCVCALSLSSRPAADLEHVSFFPPVRTQPAAGGAGNICACSHYGVLAMFGVDCQVLSIVQTQITNFIGK